MIIGARPGEKSAKRRWSRHSGGRFNLNVISAVIPRGDIRFGFIGGRMNSARFIVFLKKVHKDAAKPILVIADNARYHHSKETQRFLDQQDGNIRLAFLPACSPELNPDEQVWNHAKARLGKRSIFNKHDMQRHLTSILRSTQKQASLIRSFFRMPDTSYILEALA